jgi:hypothetical protein
MTHKLSSWIVSAADINSKFIVALPSKVVAGNNASVAMSWSGVPANSRYLGGIHFTDLNNAVQATTVVRIETGTASVPTTQSERANPLKLQD